MTLEVLPPSVTWAKVVPSGGKMRAGNVLLPTKITIITFNYWSWALLFLSEYSVLLLLALIFLFIQIGKRIFFCVYSVLNYSPQKKKISCVSCWGRICSERRKLKEDERTQQKGEANKQYYPEELWVCAKERERVSVQIQSPLVKDDQVGIAISYSQSSFTGKLPYRSFASS